MSARISARAIPGSVTGRAVLSCEVAIDRARFNIVGTVSGGVASLHGTVTVLHGPVGMQAHAVSATMTDPAQVLRRIFEGER